MCFHNGLKKNFVAYSTKNPRKELMFLHIETQKEELSDSLLKIFAKFQNKPVEGKRKTHENGYLCNKHKNGYRSSPNILQYPSAGSNCRIGENIRKA